MAQRKNVNDRIRWSHGTEQVSNESIADSLTPEVQIIGGLYRASDPTYTDGQNAVASFTSDGKLRTDASISGDVNVDSTSVSVEGYIGKASGTNGDFITAYASGTTLTCSTLPTGIASLTADDIVSIVQISTAGAVLNTYTRDDITLTASGTDPTTLTVTGATFNASDTFVVYTNISKFTNKAIDDSAMPATPGLLPVGGEYRATATTYADGDAVVSQFDSKGNLKVVGGVSSISAKYISPADFTATYTSSTTITLAGVPFTPTSEEIVYIKYIPTGGSGSAILVNGADGVTMTVSSNVITVNGAGTPFASADSYEVGLNHQDKSYDGDLDITKTIDQAPLWSRYTSPEQLVTASDIGASDGVYIDQGAEIDCTGYNVLGVFVKLTVNNSTTNTIKLLKKHTSAGSEEFVSETAANYIKTLGDANINIYYEFDINSAMPIVQIQSAAADVDTGAGTIATLEINVIKGWK